MSTATDQQSFIAEQDPEVFAALRAEDRRQEESLECIASENFVSRAVLEAYHSTLTNKYAEGYPGRRYYSGCENADVVEDLARDRLKKLFGANYANVQPHSGAQANAAVFLGILKPGETFMGLSLDQGGHLTHGSKVNFSGRSYNVVPYGVNKDDHRINFDEVARLAREHKPKMIIAGFSAYPRVLDFAKFREIADEVGAVLMADIAHISGLVAVGEHPTSVGVAHITTSTTHKTLRGPRGGIILSNTEEHGKLMNSRVFPGIQGGPLMHVIAAKAVAFGEALRPEFKEYIIQVKANARALAETLEGAGFKLVSGGTDNHIVLLDVGSRGLTGKAAADAMEAVGITANMNAIPFDPNPPAIASGVRLGSPALTTRGFGEDEFRRLGGLIVELMGGIENTTTHERVKAGVAELTRAFPMDRFRL